MTSTVELDIKDLNQPTSQAVRICLFFVACLFIQSFHNMGIVFIVWKLCIKWDIRQIGIVAWQTICLLQHVDDSNSVLSSETFVYHYMQKLAVVRVY